jgi:nucleotide sugar dehydrogenase
VEVDSKRKPEYSKIEKSIRIIANELRKGSLVIMTSVVGLGAMETLFRQPIEDTSGYKSGIDFGLVYTPISSEQNPTLESMRNRGRIVASKDKKSLEVASAFLATIHNKELRLSNDTRTAEIAAIFDGATLGVNSTLANGYAVFCEKARVEYSKVCELLNTDSLGSLFTAAQAGDIEDYSPGILLQDAENLNVKLSLVSQAEQAHAEVVKHVTNLTKDALRSCEKSVRRAGIALLGISRLHNEKSSPRTIVKALVKTLEARGAKVRLYDPFLSELELREAQIRSARNLSEALEGADCFIVVTAHDTFKRLNLKKIKVLMRLPAAIVDFEGCFEPEKVEKEGFVYRGVGSGVWSK